MSPIPKLPREIRIERGWTQNFVAELIETSGAAIADWEAGRHEPKVSSLEKWANALGYEIELMLKEPANV